MQMIGQEFMMMMQDRIDDVLSMLFEIQTEYKAIISSFTWPTLQGLGELIPRNALVPLFAIALVFWPILVSLFYAFMTASTWMIWLFTSVCLGCLQVLYVTYQFIMISADIAGLSMLKSYSMVRQQIINFIDILGGGNGQYKSRRRVWKERLEKAGTYENFLKIRIEPKSEDIAGNGIISARNGNSAKQSHYKAKSSLGNNHKDNNTDSALPPRPPQRSKLQKPDTVVRSNSFDAKARHSASYAASLSSKEKNIIDHDNNHHRQHLHSDSAGDIQNSFQLTRASSLAHFPQVGEQKDLIKEASTDSSTHYTEQANWDPIVSQELGERTAYLLVATTERLFDARRQVERMGEHADVESWNRLVFLLSAVVKRNYLNLDDILVDNARSVSDSGRYGLTSQSRQVIRKFYEQVQKCLDFLADGPTTASCSIQPPDVSSQSQSKTHPPPLAQTEKNCANALDNSSPETSPQSSTSSLLSETAAVENAELGDRIRVVRRMKHNMGRTALMLSGGGAQAMYHLGIIRALIQSKLYNDIQVISGTSGGSIAAAMCALKTPEELFRDVCVPTVSTDFTRDGEQKRKNIRWFPTIMEMASYWMKHKLLMDKDEFRRTCEFFYGNATFEEAFERTGKHICITVSASRVSGDSAQRLLLNHISTPRVTLASAVAASCALPGVMAPNKLYVKNSVGELEPFEVDGVEWIDGSVQADLPFQRISTLFAISNFIVSQTNFHVVPFLNKAHHPNKNSLYWKLFQTMEWDIRNRALKLSGLGLFPRIFGQDISKVFKQRYHGNLTIVPRFTTMQTFGLRALSNPTVKDMEGYIKYGEIATWPYLNAIREMIRLEKVLDDCLSRLELRLGSAFFPDTSWYEDGCSIASSNNVISSIPTGPSQRAPRVKILPSSCTASVLSGSHRAESSTSMKRKVKGLEEENKALKEQLQLLQKQLEAKGSVDNTIATIACVEEN